MMMGGAIDIGTVDGELLFCIGLGLILFVGYVCLR